MKNLLVLMVAVLVSGCAANAHNHNHDTVVRNNKAMAKAWKPGKRCRTIGKARTKNVAVMVARNCLRNGVTTVNMLILNPANKGKVAGADGAVLVEKILGFRPNLQVLVYGKTKGYLFMLAAVTGQSAVAVAKR